MLVVVCTVRMHGLVGDTGLMVAQPVPNSVCRFKFLGAGLHFKRFSFKKIESKVRFHVPKHQGCVCEMWRQTFKHFRRHQIDVTFICCIIQDVPLKTEPVRRIYEYVELLFL
jgi:hypothetical protein